MKWGEQRGSGDGVGGGQELFGKLSLLAFVQSLEVSLLKWTHFPPPAPLQRMESSAVLFQHLSCQLQMLVHMVGLHHSLVCCAWSLQAELLRDTWGWRGACSYFCLSLSFSKLGFFSPITIGFEKVKFNFFSCPPPMFFLFYFVLLWFDCYRFKYQDTLGTSKQIHPKNLTVLRT